MKISSDKDVDLFAKRLVREGWTFKRGRKHGKLLAPEGDGMVVIPSTPGKKRALVELESVVKRIASNR